MVVLQDVATATGDFNWQSSGQEVVLQWSAGIFGGGLLGSTSSSLVIRNATEDRVYTVTLQGLHAGGRWDTGFRETVKISPNSTREISTNAYEKAIFVQSFTDTVMDVDETGSTAGGADADVTEAASTTASKTAEVVNPLKRYAGLIIGLVIVVIVVFLLYKLLTGGFKLPTAPAAAPTPVAMPVAAPVPVAAPA